MSSFRTRKISSSSGGRGRNRGWGVPDNNVLFQVCFFFPNERAPFIIVMFRLMFVIIWNIPMEILKKKKRTKKWIKQKGENYKREDHQHTRKTKWRLGKRLQVLKLQYMYTTYNDIYIFILDLTFLIHLPVPLPVHQKNRYGIYTYKTHIFYTYYTPSFLPAPIFGSSFSWRDLTKWPNFSTPRVFSTVFMSLILAIERRQFSPDNIPVCLVFKFF